MPLRDHLRRPDPRPSPLTAADVARLTRWRSVYILGTVYGADAARRLLFLKWLREQGRFEETAA